MQRNVPSLAAFTFRTPFSKRSFQMLKSSLSAAALSLVCLTAAAAPAAAWETLGSRSVGFIADKDVISARGDGKFRQIRLCVARNDIEMRDLDVKFGNGGNQDVTVRSRIKAGSCTRAIDLKGERRNISTVSMAYASRPNFKGQAVVTLYGR
jgi:hypothetical protein